MIITGTASNWLQPLVKFNVLDTLIGRYVHANYAIRVKRLLIGRATKR